ncbi:MAG TPA: AI-2E family transporter [Bryobacteraceae bacterium]
MQPSQFILTALAVIACLYFGREVLIPFTLTLLITFLLAPSVLWLERLRLGRIGSVFIVLAVTYAGAGALLWTGAQQFSGILEKLPEYQANIHRKVEKIRNPITSSKLSRAFSSLQTMTEELSVSGSTPEKKRHPESSALRQSKATQAPAEPVPVRIVKPKEPIGPFAFVNTSSLAHLGAAIFAIAVLTLFMLLRRRDLRDRIFRLFGRSRINIVTETMNDAGQRVSRYLLAQFLINSAFGLLLGTGLFFLGVPYPLFWGAAATVLRFIPYVGTLTAGICPFVLALAVQEGWKRPLLTLALWAGVELGIASVLEPWVYAARSGISSLAILLSAAFWTVLWGPIGLIVATPLTVCLVVLGRHIPQLEFLYILFGDEPALAPEASYYQRLLARNEDEARDVLLDSLKTKPLVELYDSVLIPALSLIENDRHSGTLDEEREKFIYQVSREIIEDLPEEVPTEQEEPRHSRLPILCVPARDEADELAGFMLSQVLRQAGYEARAIPAGFMKDMLAVVMREKPAIVFVSVVPPYAVSHARSICRRVRQKLSAVKLVIGLWGLRTEEADPQERLGTECAEHVVTSLSQAILQLRLLNPDNDAPFEEESHQAETSNR